MKGAFERRLADPPSIAVVVMQELLARFTPGAAVVRATAHGRPQWMRTPPPEVRDVAVEIGQR